MLSFKRSYLSTASPRFLSTIVGFTVALSAGAEESRQSTAASVPCESKSPQRLAVAGSQKGTASWYGGSFVGGKTASGERYQPGDRTAAHRTLPFGTFVRVTNLRNRKTAVVRINNRGPYTKGRIIDLSRQAAIDLGMVNSGIARVEVQVISGNGVVGEIAAL
jgi:rare lipoprotein A